MYRFRMVLCCAAAVLTISSWTYAQKPTLESLEKRVLILESAMKEQEKFNAAQLTTDKAQNVRLDAHDAELAKHAAALVLQAQSLAQHTTDIANQVEANRTTFGAVGNLQQEFGNLVPKLDDVVRRVGQISEDRPGVGYVPVLSRQARETPSAQVILVNQMQTPVWVSVNGAFWEVRPNQQLPVPVRPGNVTTTLPGYEGAKNWFVGMENGYSVTINITPRRY